MGINTGNSKTHGNRQNTVHGVIKGVPKSQIIPTNMIKLDKFIQNVSNSKQIQYSFKKSMSPVRVLWVFTTIVKIIKYMILKKISKIF